MKETSIADPWNVSNKNIRPVWQSYGSHDNSSANARTSVVAHLQGYETHHLLWPCLAPCEIVRARKEQSPSHGTGKITIDPESVNSNLYA